MKPSALLLAVLPLSRAWGSYKPGDVMQWTNPDPDTASVQMQLSDHIIQWGTTPPWYIVECIREDCWELACDDEFTIPVSMLLPGFPHINDRGLKLRIEGEFGAPGAPGSKDDMVNILIATLREVHMVEREQNGSKDSPNIPDGHLKKEDDYKHKGDKYTAPQQIMIRANHDNGSQFKFLSIRAKWAKDAKDPELGGCQLALVSALAVNEGIQRMSHDRWMLSSLMCKVLAEKQD